jgi:hypothetical protein
MQGREKKPLAKPRDLKRLRQREAARTPPAEYPAPDPPRYKPMG